MVPTYPCPPPSHGHHQKRVPCASRSAAAAFFARMDVVMRQQGGGCSTKGDDDGGNGRGRDVVMLAVTRAGIGRRDENGQGGEKDVGDDGNNNFVTVNAIKGGRQTMQGVVVGMETTTTMGRVSPAPRCRRDSIGCGNATVLSNR
jgi:hypothetical protein